MTDIIPSHTAERYARQIIMPQIGKAGQAKLAASKILLVGVGGLGSPVALYLAAAGVGHLILVDDDRVSLSNLQRQILFDNNAVGQSKIAAATQRILAINPEIKVTGVTGMLTQENAESLIGLADIVADGSDNLKTRYLVNDTCHKMRRTLVAAAVTGFDGQMTVIKSFDGENPCYRCLFGGDEASESDGDVFGDCSGLGVLGPAAGVMGSLQAAEIIKEIVGIGESLVGKLVIYDSLATETRMIKYQKRAGCRGCS